MVKMKKTKKVIMTEFKKMSLAFQRAVLDLEKSFAPDPFKYCDFDYKLAETLKVLIYHLKQHEYRPKRAEGFDLPKGEFAIRPGVIVDILDLTIINRLLLDFIFKLEEKLPAGATAYRVRKHPKLQFKIEREPTYFVLPRYKRERVKIEESWYNLWPQYRKKLLEDLRSGKYKYVATTDITAYFEDINLLTLGEILKQKAGSSLSSINIIIEIYRSWALRDPANVRQRRGLPQGPVVSGILSNYYLDIVDTYLENERRKGHIKWYRYCDDIHVLCETKPQAIAILLEIGSRLRRLGLNQNAEKTKPLTAEKAIVQIHNEIAENISSIIDESQKKKCNRDELLRRLRIEYKEISKRRSLDEKLETSLIRSYTAASLLDSPLLIKQVGRHFLKLPTRSPSICRYARRFINYRCVLRDLRSCLKNRLLLHDFQLAFLVTVFRNIKKKDKDIFNCIVDVAFDSKRHWYVRVQAINTLSYIGVGLVKKRQIEKLLQQGNHRYVRRASISLIPLCSSPKETKNWVIEIAKDLNITISRMANFVLSLMSSKEFAMNHLKKFGPLHYVFLGDQIWRLWFIALNNNSNVKQSFNSLVAKISKKFGNYAIVKEHIKQIRENTVNV
ncbi:MAG: RNA-directed DNA polymerase [Candidatus Helarchaeota archaeon]|nr:RNA-directed DNA polymerase [Candidatus Helarchaeota archaeon]